MGEVKANERHLPIHLVALGLRDACRVLRVRAAGEGLVAVDARHGRVAALVAVALYLGLLERLPARITLKEHHFRRN